MTTLHQDLVAPKPVGFSLALHDGEVAFGNIGSGGRLDFTVIGSDVNLVSRIEPICKNLDEGILLSEALAERLPARVRLVGQFDLKGFDQPQSIFQPSNTDSSRLGRETLQGKHS